MRGDPADSERQSVLDDQVDPLVREAHVDAKPRVVAQVRAETEPVAMAVAVEKARDPGSNGTYLEKEGNADALVPKPTEP